MVFDVNEKLLNEYFDKLDIEIHYGKQSICKPISYLRELYSELTEK